MTELIPCPFCGCEMTVLKEVSRYVPVPKGKNSLYGYHKRGCQLEYSVFADNPRTKKAAIEKWNRRAGKQE